MKEKVKQNYDRKKEFLAHYIFYGCVDRNNGFDVKVINHFSVNAFSLIVKRLKYFNILMHGIEICKNGTFVDVCFSDDAEYKDEPDYPWYEKVIDYWKDKVVTFSASYDIPADVLNIFTV